MHIFFICWNFMSFETKFEPKFVLFAGYSISEQSMVPSTTRTLTLFILQKRLEEGIKMSSKQLLFTYQKKIAVYFILLFSLRFYWFLSYIYSLSQVSGGFQPFHVVNVLLKLLILWERSYTCMDWLGLILKGKNYSISTVTE